MGLTDGDTSPNSPSSLIAASAAPCYYLFVSTAELKRIVDDATVEEQRFLFVCLAEKMQPHSQEELQELDRRLADMDAGKNRLSLEEFEKRLDAANQS